MWDFLMMCTCELPFTPPALCNEAYINKMRLFPSIFVLGPEEVSYVVCSYDSVYGLQFVNLVLPLNLCARMLSRLGTKACEASRIRSRSLSWLGAMILMTPYFY